MADKGSIASGAISGATSGAMIGSVIPGVGTVIGGALGAVAGGLLGGLKKKYKAPKRASSTVYGYDTYGNLVNKGSYQFNPATGQYELRAGELSGQEKAMRANLAGNIANIINTVGTTPDAFVRYAKELSDTYYRQGERKLTEQYEKAQTRLDEQLARRGMSTSRAAADITGELQGKRFDTLADIYDAAQQYGYNIQSGLQGQARSALGALAGYQGQLMGQDQSYLSQALTAQQIGQQYENMAAGVANQNTAMENANVDSVLSSLSQLGTVAGYKWATDSALAKAAQQGTTAQNVAQAVPTNSLVYKDMLPFVSSQYANTSINAPTIAEASGSYSGYPTLLQQLLGTK